jgi:AAA lid domain
MANPLVTLDYTMWGIAARSLLKHFKTGMILIVITVALSLGWSYLSHVWFLIIVACTGSVALTRRMGQPRFANARSVRNELERARLRHAHRLAADAQLGRSRDDLMRIEPADILSSPVFSLSALDE